MSDYRNQQNGEGNTSLNFHNKKPNRMKIKPNGKR